MSKGNTKERSGLSQRVLELSLCGLPSILCIHTLLSVWYIFIGPTLVCRVSAVMGRQAHIAVIGERGHDGLQKFDSLLPEGAKVVALGSTDQIAGETSWWPHELVRSHICIPSQTLDPHALKIKTTVLVTLKWHFQNQWDSAKYTTLSHLSMSVIAWLTHAGQKEHVELIYSSVSRSCSSVVHCTTCPNTSSYVFFICRPLVKDRT